MKSKALKNKDLTMIVPKKKRSLLFFLLLTVPFNTYSMEPAPIKKKSKKKPSQIQRIVAGWVAIAEQIILGERPVRDLSVPLSPQTASVQHNESLSFTDLPEDQ